MPPGIHLDYGPDFLTRRVKDRALTLTSPLLSGLIDNIHDLQSPGIPEKPVPFKADEELWDHGKAPAKPDAPGPSFYGGVVPRLKLVKGRPRRIGLLTKKRAMRISLSEIQAWKRWLGSSFSMMRTWIPL